MLGWHISVSRQSGDGSQPAAGDSECNEPLAVWQTGLGGTRWLEDLVLAGKAVHLGGNGFPTRYSARAIDTLPHLIPKPPLARDTWHFDPGDILTDKWLGKTFLDAHAMIECPAEEWLLIVAWDES